MQSGNWVIEADANNTNGLLISSLGFVNNHENYPTNNVRAVLSVLKLNGWITIKLPEGTEIDHKLGEIEDDDDEFIKPHFESCIKFINRNLPLGNVVVHCQAGVARSATIVIAYLMKTKRWPYLEARNYLRGKRSIIDPNEGFVEQLKSYEMELKIKPANM